MNTPNNTAVSAVAKVAAAMLGCDAAQVEPKSDREWLQAVAGFDPESGIPWTEWVENLIKVSPGRAAEVLFAQFHGVATVEAFQLAIAAGLGPSLRRLSVNALKETVGALPEQGLDDIVVSTQWVSLFGKASGEAVRMAHRCAWRIRQVAGSIPDKPDPALGAWILANSQNWPSGKEGERLFKEVLNNWQWLAEVSTGISPLKARKLIRVSNTLSRKWALTPFGISISEIKMPKEDARRAARLWAMGLKVPGIYPTSTRYEREGYVGSFSPRASGDAMTVGYATDCCQHLGGVGEPCAIDSQVNPTSGVFVVRDRDGRVVAQSWVWLDEMDLGICFDNIEWKRNALTAESHQKRTKILQEIYLDAARDLESRWRVSVNVGVSYTDSTILSGLGSAPFLLAPRNYDDYSDSSEEQKVLVEGRLYQPRSGWKPVDGFAWQAADNGLKANTSVIRTEEGFTIKVEGAAKFSQEMREELVRTLADANPHMHIEMDGKVYPACHPVDVTAVRVAADADGGIDMERAWNGPGAWSISGVSAEIAIRLSSTEIPISEWAGLVAAGFAATRRSPIEGENAITIDGKKVVYDDIEVYAQSGIPWTEWTKVHSSGVTVAEVHYYANAGVPHNEWLTLHSADVGACEVHYYVNAGVPRNEWTKLRSAGVGGAEACAYGKAGVPWTEWTTLYSSGVTSDLASAYFATGLPWDQWVAMHSAGVTGADANSYRRRDIPWTEWTKFRSAGVNFPAVVTYSEAHVPQSEWIAISLQGVTWAIARAYHKAGIPWTDWSKMRSAGVTKDCATEYIEANVPWDQWVAMHSAGLTGAEVHYYANAGVPWDQWVTLYSAGVGEVHAHAYSRAGIPWTEWSKMCSEGVDPVKVHQWCDDLELERLLAEEDEMIQWRLDHGLCPDCGAESCSHLSA